LYDPLSYHYGSVWPLFTGWSAMAAYGYGRPQVGYQALMANTLLTFGRPLGYVTELLSGDFNADFGRSSHHQIWSEAMVITPIMRGLLGIEVGVGARRMRLAPQLPANWDHVTVNNIAAGEARYQFLLERANGYETIKIKVSGSTSSGNEVGPSSRIQIAVAPAFPLDARIQSVTLNGRNTQFRLTRAGDVQRAEVDLDLSNEATAVYRYDEGTDVYVEAVAPAAGASNQGLRILRSTAGANSMRLITEGLGGRSYAVRVRTPRRLGGASGVKLVETDGQDPQLVIAFDGAKDTYVRREIIIPLLGKK
jgi:hypothetical protein